ncbi:hypothetical protein IscW_ISCW006241 [Ixodes scapularis]|uniref:Uncharacterized protein n=1 Tax=Ixodes scapularis TaxID=6945 RepID=B7PMM0_IXOSC|nr:hypothetical protein IscW_ISCW006241 [Ixodes scapularis]|eukprot:XP_002435018.1 hypothetical protein IscW_ISCW006241 [Ixodes scapularis]
MSHHLCDSFSVEEVTTSSLRETLYNTFINTVFDKVLSSVAKSKAIDPVTLPNISYAFETKIILELSKFKVQQLRGVTVAIHGLGLLSRVFNRVSTEFTNLFEVQIRNAIERNIRDALAEQIGNLNDVSFF